MVPPVPIPNTVVKHLEAESTCMETCWEDRKLPVMIGVSPSGKAWDFDSHMRWFESSYPSHKRYDPLAQLVEHLTFNQRVRRSSRLRVTI